MDWTAANWVCSVLTWPCNAETVVCKEATRACKAVISARMPLSLSPRLSLSSSARAGMGVRTINRLATIEDHIWRIGPLKLLRRLTRGKRWLKDLSIATCFLDCTGSAVCFSRLWVPRRAKLSLHFAKLSESQRSRSRFRWKNAQKRPTQNIAGKKRAGQEDLDPG